MNRIRSVIVYLPALFSGRRLRGKKRNMGTPGRIDGGGETLSYSKINRTGKVSSKSPKSTSAGGRRGGGKRGVDTSREEGRLSYNKEGVFGGPRRGESELLSWKKKSWRSTKK